MIKAKALKFGDTIGLISPSSPTEGSNIEKAIKKIEEFGFKVKMGKSPYENYGYLSGSDEVRANDINQMFADKEVDGIICLRGGYGTPRILDMIDYEIVKNNPKVFLGYSDISALHIVFNQICKLVTFHGPMVTSDMLGNFSDFSKDSLFKAIMNNEIIGTLPSVEGEEVISLKGGLGQGRLIGGNLSLIADTIGTPYEIDTRGKILFIEEIEEEPYKVDRMMNQLRLSGKFKDANGIILGDFRDCIAKDPKKSLDLMEVLETYVKDLNIPVIYNLQAGHCEPMLTLAMGLEVILDGDKKQVTVLESAVE